MCRSKLKNKVMKVQKRRNKQKNKHLKRFRRYEMKKNLRSNEKQQAANHCTGQAAHLNSSECFLHGPLFPCRGGEEIQSPSLEHNINLHTSYEKSPSQSRQFRTDSFLWINALIDVFFRFLFYLILVTNTHHFLPSSLGRGSSQILNCITSGTSLFPFANTILFKLDYIQTKVIAADMTESFFFHLSFFSFWAELVRLLGVVRKHFFSPHGHIWL